MSDTHDHSGHDHEEVLVEVTLELEEDQIEVLEELAKEYTKELDQPWDMGAVVRVAVGSFLNNIKRMT